MSRPELRAAAYLLAALAVAASVPARAQIFAMPGAGARVAMPTATPGGRAEAPTAPRETLRHLPGTVGGPKLSGETGNVEWPVYLTAGQAAASLRFRIGYSSAISVLPEASRLTVRVNDAEIGTEAIDAAEGPRIIELAIPAGIARPGYNAFSVSVRQRHRVDCSVPATYELWTRIDPAGTGLVIGAVTADKLDIADLAALAPRADGSLPIHILLAGKTRPAQVERLVAATQAIAIAAHALQPLVDFDRDSEGTDGVDLALGTRATLAGIPRVAGALGTSGPLVRLMPAEAGGRPALVVTGSTDAEVDSAIAVLAAGTPARGTPQGLAMLAAYPALPTGGDTVLRLRDAGLRNEEFSGRFLRKSFNLMLPADVLIADYGRGTFDLAGGYAAGLDRTAQVRVDVNGKSSGVIKLPRAGGDTFRHNQLFLPIGLMRPGLNRIDILAETPRPGDATCAAAEGKRFLFLDSTELRLPPLAHVERLPDLAMATAGGLPFTHGNAHLVVPKPDRPTMGAALSLTARAAVAAGKLVPFAFSTRMPEGDDGSTLVVAPARALDPTLMSETGLDPARVEGAWRDVADVAAPASTLAGRWWVTNEDGPAACHLPSRFAMPHTPVAKDAATPEADAPGAVSAIAPAATTSAPASDDDLLEAWRGEARPKTSWLGDLRAWSTRAMGWVAATPAAVRARFSHVDTDGVSADASIILAQGMSRGSSSNVTTIVTAPDSGMLRAAMPCLLDPSVWSQVHGRLVALDASRGTVTATDATSFHYVSPSRTSLANTRLVVAGWFSLDPLAFVAVAMAMALSLSGTTLWFVRGIGRRQE